MQFDSAVSLTLRSHLGEIKTKFENIVACLSGVRWVQIMKKCRLKISSYTPYKKIIYVLEAPELPGISRPCKRQAGSCPEQPRKKKCKVIIFAVKLNTFLRVTGYGDIQSCY